MVEAERYLSARGDIILPAQPVTSLMPAPPPEPLPSYLDEWENRCSPRVPGIIYQLLCDLRKIDRSVVESLIKSDQVRVKTHCGVKSVAFAYRTLQGDDIHAIQYLTADGDPYPFTINEKGKGKNKFFGTGHKSGAECFFIAGESIRTSRLLILCESVINAITAAECFPDACCLALGGSTHVSKVKALKPYYNNFEKIVISGDKDDASEKMIQAIYRELVSGAGINRLFAISFSHDDPEGYDINDLLKTGQKQRIIDMVSDAGLVTGPLQDKADVPDDTDQPIEQRIEDTEDLLRNTSDKEKREALAHQLNHLKFTFARGSFPRCPFPWETLPARLEDSLKQLARSCSTNPMHLVGTVLAIVGAAVGRHVEVSIKDSWNEPLIFWILSLLDSGDGKTPALNLLCKVLEERQKHLDAIYKAEHKEFENADKGSLIQEPVQPGGLYTTDYTIEALFRDQPLNGGTMIINDEASGFFDGQNQYKSGGRGTDRQQMLKLYDGKRARKIRVKDTLTLEGSRINIAGGTQPPVFKKVFDGDGDIFHVDGTLFRFMMTYDRGFYPATTESWEFDSQEYWEQTIRNIFDFCDSHTTMDDEGDSRVVTTSLIFTSPALDYFIDWQNEYRAIKRFFPDALGGYLPKMFGWTARITGALKCLDEFQNGSEIHNPTIDINLLERAIKIAEFYMGQNCEIMREMTLKVPSEKTFTDQEKHLCLTLQSLKPEIDNGRLAVAFILQKYNEDATTATRLKNSKALTALIRSAGLTIPRKKFTANGFKNYTCLSWNKKTENLIEKFSTFSTNSTSLQPQGFEEVENVSTNSTFSTTAMGHLQNRVEKVEEKKPFSTSGKPAMTGEVEQVEKAENFSQEISKNEDDVVII